MNETLSESHCEIRLTTRAEEMLKRSVNESTVEQAALDWLESTGWSVRNGAAIAATPPFAERIA
jgi:hypothetical protein